jgi:hypothetical protein
LPICLFVLQSRKRLPAMMKSSLDHLAERKQRDLARALSLQGDRFGSCARGDGRMNGTP